MHMLASLTWERWGMPATVLGAVVPPVVVARGRGVAVLSTSVHAVTGKDKPIKCYKHAKLQFTAFLVSKSPTNQTIRSNVHRVIVAIFLTMLAHW